MRYNGNRVQSIKDTRDNRLCENTRIPDTDLVSQFLAHLNARICDPSSELPDYRMQNPKAPEFLITADLIKMRVEARGRERNAVKSF
jgi:hypothetical protein